MYFQKLDLDLDFTQLVEEQLRGSPTKAYGKIFYHKLSVLPATLQPLVERLRPDKVRWVNISGTPWVRPHVDHGLTAAINIYVQAGGAITTFYKKKPNAVAAKFDDTEATANMYETDQLEVVGLFTALDGDSYILNNAQIHSVELANPERKFVQMSWVKRSYQSILEELT